MDREALILAIENFASARGLAPATITSRAVGNSRLYSRLKAGGDCTTEIASRVRAFIAAASEEPKPPRGEDAA
jgi:hypothetical protein